MGVIFQKQIDFLLNNACPSIQYLVHRDILKARTDEPYMKKLQEELLQQSNIQKHLNAQHPDGWFGHELHGCDGMDCHISGLIGAGVEPDNPCIQKAAEALVSPETAAQHKNWFHGGEALDADGRGGNRAVTAGILLTAKASALEDIPVLRDEIKLSFEHLSAVLSYNSPDEFSIRGKNKRYYKPNVKFPGANHIGLLAGSNSWKTEENLKTAKNAVHHGYELMKDFDEYITFKKPAEYGGGFVGPFNYNWQALSPVHEEKLYNIINSTYNFQFVFWLSAVTGVPDWARQSNATYELIADMLERNAIFSMLPDKALNAFRQVMGKEPNWRKKTAAECDVMFALLKACYSVVAQ